MTADGEDRRGAAGKAAPRPDVISGLVPLESGAAADEAPLISGLTPNRAPPPTPPPKGESREAGESLSSEEGGGSG